VVNKRVVSLTQSHTEVLGAALLAGVGLGLYSSYKEAVASTVVTGDTFEPDAGAHLAYSKLFPMYKQLYLDTKHHFHRLVELDLPQGWIGKGDKK
jgi:xylulokinase